MFRKKVLSLLQGKNLEEKPERDYDNKKIVIASGSAVTFFMTVGGNPLKIAMLLQRILHPFFSTQEIFPSGQEKVASHPFAMKILFLEPFLFVGISILQKLS